MLVEMLDPAFARLILLQILLSSYLSIFSEQHMTRGKLDFNQLSVSFCRLKKSAAPEPSMVQNRPSTS
jgi:hypothetical protein